ncbi:hypothetical protein SRB5_06040 [Streptomyces sp. RB5]|uniref:Uncharacterized protein n=1 Tax=Streptomyces smaragdinus TaxID=2585196 RepID=A0A7K0CAR7_9ACTN|nr:hypothetical protein [Streptomyces smaragdinus]MQY10496.1 hypothetical protein [Streptomyces smaragdinus]
MTTPQPPAEELRHIDAELAMLDARRAQLVARRAWLLDVLRTTAGPAGPPPFRPSWQPRPATAAPEVSPPSAQNVLLTLGGVLLAIAALAFTLVSWGSMGTGGRALVLGTVTAVTGGIPVLLTRRGLTSSAEAVGALALVLTLVDALAVRLVADPADETGFWAVAFAVLTAGWLGYGLLLRGLRLPLPAGVVAGQAVLPLLAATAGGDESVLWALVATAAADLAAVLWITRPSVRRTAVVAAWTVGGCGLLGGLALSLSAQGAALALRSGALLVAGGGVALYAAWRARWTAPSVVGALAVIGAVGGVIRVAVPDDWAVPGYLLPALLVAAVALSVPEQLRRGLAAGAAVVQAIALWWAVPVLAAAVLGPVRWTSEVWSGAPDDIRGSSSFGELPWGEGLQVPVTLAVSAAAGVFVARAAAGRARDVAACAALALAGGAALTLPATTALAYPAALVLLLCVTGAALTTAVVLERRGGADAGRTRPGLVTTALCLGLVAAADATLAALATETATLAVCAAVLAATAGATAALRHPAYRAVVAAAATAWATGLAVAAPAAAGLPAHQVAPVVLLVPALASLLAERLKEPAVGPAIEATGAAAGLLALALAAGDAAWLAGALALAGVVAAGTALRAERRWAGYASGVLFVCSLWARLAASGVDTPEAYTLPASLVALAAGWLRRRRDAEFSSWAAYGPGLAATLLPSLAAAWGDPHWQRPLLLGLAALAVTLLGARHRLQAPLLLGAGVLALDTLHELAPYVMQVVGALPRWLPPALVGVLLLAVGATYEQRLREARRVRASLGRMR